MSNPFEVAARDLEARGSRAIAPRIRAEGRIAKALIAAALKAGYSVSINDGEEVVVRRSRDAKAIIAAMFSTDEDGLLIHGADGKKAGWFQFIYGNDGYDVISDYTANDACELIVIAIQPIIDREESRLS